MATTIVAAAGFTRGRGVGKTPACAAKRACNLERTDSPTTEKDAVLPSGQQNFAIG